MPPRRVAIVPHTHWDREWYEPFQTFRLRLVELLDDLLDLMESDPSYARYLLDGQMAVIDDYLEVRPEHEDAPSTARGHRARRGGTVVHPDGRVPGLGRDDRARPPARHQAGAAFGGVAEVGYLPDMFGHVAQMPQILATRRFRARGRVARRTRARSPSRRSHGAPLTAARCAPSTCSTATGAAALLPDDAKAFVARVDGARLDVLDVPSWRRALDERLGPRHAPALPRPARSSEANALQDDYEFGISSLAEYLVRRTDRRPRGLGWRAAQWVPGERADGRRLQPRGREARGSGHGARSRATRRAPHGALRRARRMAARRCSSSRGERSSATPPTTRSAHAASTRSSTRCCTASTRRARSPTASPAARSALSATRCATGATSLPTARLERAAGSSRSSSPATLDEDPAVQVVGERHRAARRARASTPPRRAPCSRSSRGRGSTTTRGSRRPRRRGRRRARAHRQARSVRAARRPPRRGPSRRCCSKLAATPDAMVRVRLDQPTIRRVLARTVRGRRASAGPASSPSAQPLPRRRSTTPGACTLTNGAGDGRRSTQAPARSAVDGHAGFGRLVDGGDLGDSYNYSPPGGDTARRDALIGRRDRDRARPRPRDGGRDGHLRAGRTTSTPCTSSAWARTRCAS